MADWFSIDEVRGLPSRFVDDISFRQVCEFWNRGKSHPDFENQTDRMNSFSRYFNMHKAEAENTYWNHNRRAACWQVPQKRPYLRLFSVCLPEKDYNAIKVDVLTRNNTKPAKQQRNKINQVADVDNFPKHVWLHPIEVTREHSSSAATSSVLAVEEQKETSAIVAKKSRSKVVKTESTLEPVLHNRLMTAVMDAGFMPVHLYAMDVQFNTDGIAALKARASEQRNALQKNIELMLMEKKSPLVEWFPLIAPDRPDAWTYWTQQFPAGRKHAMDSDKWQMNGFAIGLKMALCAGLADRFDLNRSDFSDSVTLDTLRAVRTREFWWLILYQILKGQMTIDQLFQNLRRIMHGGSSKQLVKPIVYLLSILNEKPRLLMQEGTNPWPDSPMHYQDIASMACKCAKAAEKLAHPKGRAEIYVHFQKVTTGAEERQYFDPVELTDDDSNAIREALCWQSPYGRSIHYLPCAKLTIIVPTDQVGIVVMWINDFRLCYKHLLMGQCTRMYDPLYTFDPVVLVPRSDLSSGNTCCSLIIFGQVVGQVQDRLAYFREWLVHSYMAYACEKLVDRTQLNKRFWRLPFYPLMAGWICNTKPSSLPVAVHAIRRLVYFFHPYQGMPDAKAGSGKSLDSSILSRQGGSDLQRLCGKYERSPDANLFLPMDSFDIPPTMQDTARIARVEKGKGQSFQRYFTSELSKIVQNVYGGSSGTTDQFQPFASEADRVCAFLALRCHLAYHTLPAFHHVTELKQHLDKWKRIPGDTNFLRALEKANVDAFDCVAVGDVLQHHPTTFIVAELAAMSPFDVLTLLALSLCSYACRVGIFHSLMPMLSPSATVAEMPKGNVTCMRPNSSDEAVEHPLDYIKNNPLFPAKDDATNEGVRGFLSACESDSLKAFLCAAEWAAVYRDWPDAINMDKWYGWVIPFVRKQPGFVLPGELHQYRAQLIEATEWRLCRWYGKGPPWFGDRPVNSYIGNIVGYETKAVHPTMTGPFASSDPYVAMSMNIVHGDHALMQIANKVPVAATTTGTALVAADAPKKQEWRQLDGIDVKNRFRWIRQTTCETRMNIHTENHDTPWMRKAYAELIKVRRGKEEYAWEAEFLAGVYEVSNSRFLTHVYRRMEIIRTVQETFYKVLHVAVGDCVHADFCLDIAFMGGHGSENIIKCIEPYVGHQRAVNVGQPSVFELRCLGKFREVVAATLKDDHARLRVWDKTMLWLDRWYTDRFQCRDPGYLGGGERCRYTAYEGEPSYYQRVHCKEAILNGDLKPTRNIKSFQTHLISYWEAAGMNEEEYREEYRKRVRRMDGESDETSEE